MNLPHLPAGLPNIMGEAPDWRYEMRREAQEIIPNLFVGPYQSSRDLTKLQQQQITHICCVSENCEAHVVKPRFPEHFDYLVMDVRDASDQNLISFFPRVKAYIDNALVGRGRVLVHCCDGISRSPALVTAYVMVTYNLSHEDAFQYVQSRRFCISPNPGFLRQLEAYEPIYRASATMHQSGLMKADVDRPNPRRKRSEDEDDEMDGTMDARDPDSTQRIPTWRP